MPRLGVLGLLYRRCGPARAAVESRREGIVGKERPPWRSVIVGGTSRRAFPQRCYFLPVRKTLDMLTELPRSLNSTVVM
jgi:hypothetical protein